MPSRRRTPASRRVSVGDCRGVGSQRMTPILDVTNDITARALSHPEVFADAVERLDKGKPSILYHKAQIEGSAWSRWTEYGSCVVNYIREFVAVLIQPQIGFLQDTGLAACAGGGHGGPGG